jgi:hypothetical protein
VGLIGCPETSVWNYHSALCYIPEERRSRLLSQHKPEIMHEDDLFVKCDYVRDEGDLFVVRDEDDLFVQYDYVRDEGDLFVKM